MHEDFTGNTLGTAKALELTSSLQTFTGSVSPLDTNDYYGFNLSNRSSFNMTLSGLGANADVELLNSGGEVLQTSAQLGTSSESLFTSLDAGSYYIKVYSGAETTTDYSLNLSATPSQDVTSLQNRDSLTGFDNPSFDTGVFTVGSSGQVSIDYLFDGGLYQGELAIFSLEGMEQYQTDLNEFIAEAARRALSYSQLGHVVISDSAQGARFHSSLLGEPDYNSGNYLGVNTFSMRPGDTFGVMLVPNGTVQEVFANPGVSEATRPLFSLSTTNPNDAFHVGQIADVTGDGNTFVMEDLRVDGFSDKDYNDIIFQFRGATGTATKLDDAIDPAYDWRTTDLGQALINYATPYVNLPTGSESEVLPTVDSEGVVPPLTEVDGVWTPVDGVTSGNSLPVMSQPLVTLPVDSDFDPMVAQPGGSEPIQFDFPVANQPLIGVIDTGFSGNNADIDYSRIILGSDRISNDDNPLLQPGEGNEHGTHVLGIIAATQNNGIGIDGVNDKAPIWLGRAVGSGQWAESLVDFVDAARASNQKNAVVNLSLDLTQVNPDGSVTTRYELTPAERSALEYARQSNVLVVVAAGNDGGVMSALGQASQEFDNIITVGAADGANRAAYSSYGYGLDILAPGGTTENPMLSIVGDGVGTMAGTSVASATVTGAVSQVWAANPALSYRQVVELLKSTATDLDKPNWDEFTAAGLLNLAAAVLLAKVTTPLEYEAAATVVPETWSGEGKVTPSDRAAAVPMWPTVEPTSFRGRVMATIGANVRSGPGTSYPIVGSRSYNSYVNFDGWTYGERITDIALGTPDERWYRIAGTNQWIASAIIDGNAPGSTPLPPGNSGGGGTPLPQPSPQVPINSNSANYRDGRVNPFAYRWQGQCTWYTYGRMLETGLLPAGTKANGWFLGDAWMWKRDAQRVGLPITSTPTPGARGIVVWPPYTKGTLQWGHVAFLEEVYPDGRIRISESNWAGKGISERILTPAEYSGLSFVRLENATPNLRYSSPPAQPGKQREYRVRSGDTLLGIAFRELGNANRWREIKKADGSTFTEAEARNLQVGMSVYLPVTYQTGTGTPVTSPPSSTPQLTLIRTGGGDGQLNYWRFDKALQYMYEEMKRNVASSIASSIRSSLWQYRFVFNAYLQASNPILKNLFLTAAITYYASALKAWATTVRAGADWDHKPKLADMLGLKGTNGVEDKFQWWYSLFPSWRDDDFYFPIRGDSEHEYFYDFWSNIHYGYLGTAIGFSRNVLQYGASVGDAVLAGVNDQSDMVTVDIGIDLWNKYGTALTVNQLQEAILSKREQLNRTDGIINGV